MEILNRQDDLLVDTVRCHPQYTIRENRLKGLQNNSEIRGSRSMVIQWIVCHWSAVYSGMLEMLLVKRLALPVATA